MLHPQIKQLIQKFLIHSPNFNTVTVNHLTSLLNIYFNTTEITESEVINILLESKYKIKNRYDYKVIGVKRWSFNVFIQIVYLTEYLRSINFRNEYKIRYLETVGLQNVHIDINCYNCNVILNIHTKYNKYPHILYENILFEAIAKGIGIINVNYEDNNPNDVHLLCPLCYSKFIDYEKQQLQIKNYNFFDHRKLNLPRLPN